MYTEKDVDDLYAVDLVNYIQEVIDDYRIYKKYHPDNKENFINKLELLMREI